MLGTLHHTGGARFCFSYIQKDLGCWDYRSKRYQDDSNLEGFHRAHMFALLVTEQLDSWPEQNERQRKWVS
jgi:diphosphoinositol-polyphosphate diphosphatase